MQQTDTKTNYLQEDLEAILFDGLDLSGGLEETLWDAANHLRSNSTLKASEYATPVLGLIFLKYASSRFDRAAEKSVKEFESQTGRSKKSLAEIYIRNCGFYLPETSHFNYLLNLPGEEDMAKAIIEAMEGIEANNADLAGTLPKNQYHKIKDTNTKEDPYHILRTLLKSFSTIPVDDEGDLFGKIYEYFLGNFALSEGQKGGEFFTPTSIVKLIVEIIEPFRGRIFDPACGSGGMFVQSAKFIKRHALNPNGLSVWGQERTGDTVNLAKMNLAVNGLSSDISNSNSYYDDPFKINEKIREGRHDELCSLPPSIKKIRIHS